MRRSSPSRHGQFFTSLKQLEKRLKLENNLPPPTTVSPPPPPPPRPPLHTQHQPNISSTQNSDSLGTPMYIIDEPPSDAANTFASTLPESEAPREFMSNFPSTHDSPLEENRAEIEETLDRDESSNLNDEIVLLMQQLGLSDSAEPKNMVGRFAAGCDDGFYERIVGVKGPKSGKEVERLEGWIKHFLNGEVKEPFRLAHLLLAKAAFVHLGGNGDGFEGFEFPCTIAEFFENDPPLD